MSISWHLVQLNELMSIEHLHNAWCIVTVKRYVLIVNTPLRV